MADLRVDCRTLSCAPAEYGYRVPMIAKRYVKRRFRLASGIVAFKVQGGPAPSLGGNALSANRKPRKSLRFGEARYHSKP